MGNVLDRRIKICERGNGRGDFGTANECMSVHDLTLEVGFFQEIVV